MPKNAKKPQIRFKGFTDAWEQRKLGDVAIVNPKDEVPSIFEYVDLESVIGTKMVSHRTETKNTAPSRAQRVARLGDLFYQTVRPYQKNNYLFEKAGKNYVFSTGYAQLRPLIDGYFLLSIVQSARFVKIVLDNCTGTSYPAINANDLANIEISYSYNIDECRKIGKFFRNLDNLITLHQRKLDKLKNIKKSMLEKMFPKNGSNIPEIRFKGFTDAWEQRKLGEIANKVLDKNIGLQYVETLTNSAEYGIISQREFFDHNISKIESLEGYYIVQNNDFVYNPRISTTAPVGPINRNKLGRSGVMSPLYTVFRVENVDFTFLEYFFKTNCWHAFMNYNGDSGARSDRFSIKDNIFFEMPIVIPRIEEQIKIGKYMLKLDNLITLHQRERLGLA